MTTLIGISVFVAIIILAIAICIAVFVGFGYLVSVMTSMSLFQGCIVSLGSSFILVFLAFGLLLIRIDDAFRGEEINEDEDEDEDEDENEYDKLERNEFLRRRFGSKGFGPRMGRNQKCPCGSGRKYKNCCGKTSR